MYSQCKQHGLPNAHIFTIRKAYCHIVSFGAYNVLMLLID